ncbi:uncharacterized protein LOC142225036 [Haematobia irritans]|uniref:uncharacterized protein LOC142225036 n=1 Tax=Haematobia irritans TaxID=7368 RepID=UPI003F4FEE32
MTALLNFTRISDSLIIFNAGITDDILANSSVHSLEVHREEIREIWQRVKPSYDESLNELSSHTGEETKQDIETIQARYQTVNLPPCDTEVFHGDYSSWPTFRDLFTAIYINNSRLSLVEKLFHLNNKTRGEARDIVRKAPLTNDGFDVAWNGLKTRFENKRLLINSQLKILLNLENISTETTDSIKLLQSTVNGVISSLKLYQVDVRTWDPIFVYICCTKLPEVTLTLWEQSVKSKTECPPWGELDCFLTTRFQTLETVCDLSTASASVKVFTGNKVSAKSSIQKRSHISKDCKSTYNCVHCGQRHNTYLHRNNSSTHEQTAPISRTVSEISEGDPNYAPESENSLSNTESTTNAVQSCAATGTKMVLLGTAIVDVIHHGDVFKARALFDNGSEASFISQSFFNLLKLESNAITTEISGLNGSVSAWSYKSCALKISSPIQPHTLIHATTIVIPKLTSSLPAFTANSNILFGSDIIPTLMLQGVMTEVCGSLMAQETIFGWILTGPISKTSVVSFHTTVCLHNDIALDKQISKFWEMEDLPRKKQLSPDEQFCEENFQKTTKRDLFGRYVVTLPFKENFRKAIKLGQSRGIAVAQFLRNENRILKNVDLNEQYSKVLKEYIDLGHMKGISSIQYPNYENSYYMPHHAVVRPESSTTKVRVVFNASSSTSNGISLDDTLHCGPSLQKDLNNLLLNWRFHKIVFNGDIEKMYRQILVDSEHTPFQRIIYRNSPLEELSEYELQTVTFGVNCAPYLAMRVIQQLAVDVMDTHPLASDVLQSCMYVDDVLAGSHDVHSSIRMKSQLVSALKSAGFSLRKWTSNSKEFLASIPKEYLLNEEFLEFEDSSMAKTLGVRWNARSDCFYFSAKTLNNSTNPTKRQVLSEISKLFDPAGWLCPYIVLAKLLMRDIWVSKIGWDEQLCPEDLRSWNLFVENYSQIGEMRIARWLNFTPGCDVQLHGFCDASERAYAAAIYIRISTPIGSVTTHLLTAKSKVSPLKTISIPRLELCGALLLSETMDSIQNALPIQSYEIYCWTDSTIVLAWLSQPSYHRKTFVANRVSKISEIVGKEHWYHVESKDNPADIGSRGAYPKEFSSNNLWLYGPPWLKLAPSFWPLSNPNLVDESLLEPKTIQVHCSNSHNFEDPLNRFSSLGRALRVLSYVFRFTFICKKMTRFDSITISSSEISNVRNRLILLAQKQHFPLEYKQLSNKKELQKSSSLSNLNPFLDKDKLLRIHSRIDTSNNLTYDERFPLILPYKYSYLEEDVQILFTPTTEKLSLVRQKH